VEPDALPSGTRLDKFEILQVLGVGGFGIVYLALDHTLERQVAIKEYMPAALAARGYGSLDVVLRSASHAETYTIGLHSFINEARLLAGFDHPALVKVHQFWEAHGTAYMVMQYYQGRTLNTERRAMHGPPCEAWLRGITEPLLSALELLHNQGVFHRDISPDNIIVMPSGQPVLLDFGAARRVVGDRTQSLTAILKPNFAPVEQYADVPTMRQGGWTDLYALGAVVYFMLKGVPPVPAVTRAVHDDMPALANQAGATLSGVSVPFLGAIDWALAIAPQDRPQSVQALRDAFDGKIVPPRWSRQRSETLVHAVTHLDNRPAPSPMTTIRALRGRYAPTRLVPTFHVATAPGESEAQKQARKATGSARRSIALIATVAFSVLALGAWKLSERTTAKPVIPAAIEVKTKTPAPPTVRQRAPTATARPTPKPVAAAAAADPQAACADRNFFARPICLSARCKEPQFAAHAVCVQLQRDEELRQQAQTNR
jgi:serine/threonine protein kinase